MHARKALVRCLLGVALAAALATGCAQLIGAEFEGAHAADDAAAPLEDAPTVDPDAIEGPSLDATDDDDHAPFDAMAPGNLVFWVAADRGVAAGSLPEGGDGSATFAAAWSDQSGRGHDLGQAFLAKQPLLVSAGKNGLPVIRFERSRGTCYGSTWLGNLDGKGATIFYVAKGEPISLVRLQGPTPTYLVFPWNARYAEPDAAPDPVLLVATTSEVSRVRAPFEPSKWTIASARVELGKVGGMQVWRDGKLLESASVLGDAMPYPEGFQVGCGPGQQTEFADGDVGEILLYAAPLSDREREGVEHYLARKWNIDL